MEQHIAETDDGFYLSVIRIPHGKNANTQSGPKPVVFLQHGLLDSACTWVRSIGSGHLCVVCRIETKLPLSLHRHVLTCFHILYSSGCES